MMLPSQALNREFVLSEDVQPQVMAEAGMVSLTTHAVRIGDIGLLLPSGEVSELVDRLPVCKLPNTPGWFSGVSSLRGNITPIFDLHQLFGIATTSHRRRVIVVGTGETAIAFWVDDMPRMVSLSQEDRMEGDPPLPDLVKRHAIHYFLRDNQIWVEWDVHRFFISLGDML